MKRYALTVIFIRAQYSKTLDDAADIFIRLMQNIENSARQQLVAYQLESQSLRPFFGSASGMLVHPHHRAFQKDSLEVSIFMQHRKHVFPYMLVRLAGKAHIHAVPRPNAAGKSRHGLAGTRYP